MKPILVDARCPICQHWYREEAATVNQPGECGNCHQAVTLVPGRNWLRVCANVALVIGCVAVIVFSFWLYHAREEGAFKAMAPSELPDNSPPMPHRN